ncbi:MAG: M28 family peptidase [Actinobacteria bacterium]|nr:M28 family peptidase [Actinomycetota bacterium]
MAAEMGRAPAVEAAVDDEYLRRAVARLASIGSSPLGFRVTGTPEDRETAEYVAGELHAIGLEDVRLEPVQVDAWRFFGARLDVGGETFECATFGGAPPTPAGGIEGELVDAGRGTRRELAKRDVRGKILLVDWRGDPLLWPSYLAAEAAQHGAAAIVCTTLEGGRYYQEEGALGSFDALWIPGGAPLATIRREDALALLGRLASGTLHARLTVELEVEPDATGWNPIGTLPGREDGPPVFVAGHHDAWFYGAIDDATGVAATLALARALVAAGHVPERPIVFGSHTAEEYGIADSPFDWLTGAWSRLEHAHPEWREGLALYVNVEGAGFELPIQVDHPPELARFCRRVAAGARRDGLLPHGIVYGPPRSATELWPMVAGGVPGISVQTAVKTYATHHYHTPFDDLDLVDFRNLGVMTRFYSRLVLAADRSPETLLDPQARATDLRRRGRLDAAAATGADTATLEAALVRYEATRPRDAAAARRAFAVAAPELEALHARDKQSRLHLQALADVEAIDEAIAALERGDRRAAARAATRCGRNMLARDIGREVFTHDLERHRPDHPRIAWGAKANLTESPDLWLELASLRAEPGAPAPDGWVTESLRAKREQAARELQQRIDRTARALDAAAAILG